MTQPRRSRIWSEPAERRAIRGFAVLIVATASVGASAGEAGGSLGWITPEIKPFTAAATVAGEFEPATDLGDGEGDYQRTTARIGLRVQVWHDDHNEVQVNGSWAETTIDTEARFATIADFPAHLYDVRLGGLYKHVTDDKWVYGLNASLGFADRVPFSSGDGRSVSASAFLRMPTAAGNAWIFSLSYSDDRTTLNGVPFPGVIYEWNPQPTFKALFGLPFCFAYWKATPTTTIDASASVFATAHAGVSHTPFAAAKWLRVNAAYDWGAETWKWPDHIPSDRRVYFRNMRFTAGLGADAGPLIGASLFAGYAFNRQALYGTSVFKVDDHIDIPAGWICGFSARLGF